MSSTVTLPSKELEPYVDRALADFRQSRESATVRDLVRVTDAILRDAGDERVVHPQTLRKLLNDSPRVHRRAARLEEKPVGVSPNTKVYLYSLTNPVPAYSHEFHDQLESDYPEPREVPLSGRRRRIGPAPSRSPALDERAEVLVTLVRELVRDASEAAANDETVRALEEEVERLTTLNKELTVDNARLTKRMRVVERAQRLLLDATEAS